MSRNGRRHFYIVRNDLESGFKYGYEIYHLSMPTPRLRERIDALIRLALELEIPLLASDDQIAPFTYVYIEPSGETSTVSVDTEQGLVVIELYGFPWGYFRTRQSLTSSEFEQLRSLLTFYYDIEVDYGACGPVINGSFNKIKDSMHQLRGFDHHYEVKPLGKNRWVTLEEKEDLFMRLMTDFHQVLQTDLCVFVRRVAHSSDRGAEEHLQVFSHNTLERIVYYRRPTN